MLKLLNVDAAGERALRVVSYFDELLVHRPDLESVVRATAILADCAAGLQVPGRTTPLYFTPDGQAPVHNQPAIETAGIDIEIDDAGARPAHAWLQRSSAAGDLDDFILERMALVVATVFERRRHTRFADTPIGFADPALAALLVNDRASDADRIRAARLMGLSVPGQIQAVALAVDHRVPPDLDALRKSLSRVTGRPAYVSLMSNEVVLGVTIGLESHVAFEDAVELRAAIGPSVDVVDAPKSWAAARQSLRFAGLGPTWPQCVWSEELGTLSLLLSLDSRQVLLDPDVLAMQRLSETVAGMQSMQILEHLVHTESLRSAARGANFHHSTLQARLQRIEAVLGINLRDGIGRQRAAQALLLWQLFVRK